MLYQNLNAIINDYSDVKSYILFRDMEEWCYENLPTGNWKLDWSVPVTAYGVDIPSRIIFKEDSDVTAFKLRFLIAD